MASSFRITTSFHACTRCAKIKELMINGESVEKACSEVGEYSDEKMIGEFDRFFRAQPAICDFIVELTHESGHKIQELSLFLSYMVFKAIEMDISVGVTAVTPDAIESAYRESESWIEQVKIGRASCRERV